MKQDEKCKYCGGSIEIRNPIGKCDHLYWPDMLTEDAKIANGFRLVTKHVWEKSHLTGSAEKEQTK